MRDFPPLIVEDLSFRYRDRADWALRSISLRLERGELLLVAGASGCGKTTLIRCVNGLIPRSYKGELTGRVVVGGQETQGVPLARISEMVGTVLQDPERQILGTRVANEVAFGLENLGLPREEILSRVAQAMDQLGISPLRDRETFSLSGGEKQKVALAGVLAMRPRVLLLDEPLASLDPASAQEALAMVRQLVDEGMAVLLIEHRVEDALKIVPDRVMFMAAGQVRYLGLPEGLNKVVDYREVKMPAPIILERAAKDPPPAYIQFSPAGDAPEAGAGPVPLVEFKDVSFHYEPGESVLGGISLSIRRGDVIAILGPNGAGKTTL